MEGDSGRTARLGYRWRVGAASGLGALAIASIFVLSSVANAGVARPASFPGAYWAPFTYRDNSGCAQAHAYPAHWTALTGHGTSKGSTSAKTCPAYRGGSAVASYGSVEQELQVWAPVAMPSGTGGINVSWDLNLAASQSTGLTGSTACPTNTYHYNYNYGYTWFNYTYTSGYCFLESYLDIAGFTYLYDMTTSTYTYSSNYWSGLFNETYQYNDTYGYSYNYSNSSYWAYNYSYGPYSYSYSAGGAGGFTGAFAPQWFINGTFVSTDSYQVITYIFGYQSSEMAYYGGPGHAATTINMAGTTHHENLLPFSIW